MPRSWLACSAPSLLTFASKRKSDRNSIASTSASSTILKASFEPSASRRPHNIAPERVQNPHFDHYNGLIRASTVGLAIL